ncbi:hypothetical protein BO78DRAFT_45551 [Aspergillus sclerotiicarbonarius CBS 121057]|uniref:Uncharacterized protein n=1 Tax=Aspergillus sclerotiicarbonarius (strain CBS 121057 / IBT 28362) TaxID=1448318 RepID=A0A319DVZ9_ASPSB|nr:hypothetical protein BO78DRAFT_45551 [Aspergillus sclerotiicarbonarius CBS 121057]
MMLSSSQARRLTENRVGARHGAPISSSRITTTVASHDASEPALRNAPSPPVFNRILVPGHHRFPCPLPSPDMMWRGLAIADQRVGMGLWSSRLRASRCTGCTEECCWGQRLRALDLWMIHMSDRIRRTRSGGSRRCHGRCAAAREIGGRRAFDAEGRSTRCS